MCLEGEIFLCNNSVHKGFKRQFPSNICFAVASILQPILALGLYHLQTVFQKSNSHHFYKIRPLCSVSEQAQRKQSNLNSEDSSDFVGLYMYLIKRISPHLNQILNTGLSTPIIHNLISFITILEYSVLRAEEPGEEKAPGRSHCSLPVLKGDLKKMRDRDL